MRPIDLAELVLLAALWGASFLFMRVAAPVLGPIWLITVRVLLAGLLLLPFVIRANLWSQVRPKLGQLLFVGVINLALPFSLFAFAAIHLPAGFTSLLNATVPLFGALLTTFWFRQSLRRSQWAGVGLGFCGVVILMGWKPIVVTASFGWAILAGLLAALLYAIAANYIKRNLSDVPPLGIAATTLLFAPIVLLPGLPFTMPQTLPSLPIVASVVGLAIFSTALASIIYLRLINQIGATKVLTVTYLIPLFAMLWGRLFLQEPITPAMALGCGLILCGTAIANRR